MRPGRSASGGVVRGVLGAFPFGVRGAVTLWAVLLLAGFPGVLAMGRCDAADPVDLATESIRVTVAPDRGGSLLALAVRRGDAWLELMPDGRAAGARPSSWLMLPYSNRIRDGRFTFRGETHQLRNAKNHAIHGDVRNRPWTVAEQGTARIVLAFDSHEAPDFDWPWPIRARVEIAIEGDALVQRLALENRGDTPMPAGFGWHPYFRRVVSREGEPVELAFRATGRYPDSEPDGLPDGQAIPLPPELDYSSRKAVPADGLDACFAGFDGKAELAWPESRVRLLFECTPNVTHLICFAPADRPVIAVEPAANASDGVNLRAAGLEGTGVIELAPGESLDAAFTLRVLAE